MVPFVTAIGAIGELTSIVVSDSQKDHVDSESREHGEHHVSRIGQLHGF